MKKQILLIAVMIASCVSIPAMAQLHVSINIGTQPAYGPSGYDNAQYYYMPDVDAYYDVADQQYVYYDNNAWICSRVLPPRYSNYDMYNMYKVVINEPRPWMHHERDYARYYQYRGRHDHHWMWENRDNRYYAANGYQHQNGWNGYHGNYNNGFDRRADVHQVYNGGYAGGRR